MRDLKADLEICNKATEGPWRTTVFGQITNNQNDSWDRETIICDTVHESQGPYKNVRDNAKFIAQAREGWPYAIERAIEAEGKLEKAKDLIQRWFDGEISAFDVMDSMIIDLEFDIDGIPDEVLEYHNIKRKKGGA